MVVTDSSTNAEQPEETPKVEVEVPTRSTRATRSSRKSVLPQVIVEQVVTKSSMKSNESEKAAKTVSFINATPAKVKLSAQDTPVADVQKPTRRTRKISGDKASDSSAKSSPEEPKTTAKRAKAKAHENAGDEGKKTRGKAKATVIDESVKAKPARRTRKVSGEAKDEIKVPVDTKPTRRTRKASGEVEKVVEEAATKATKRTRKAPPTDEGPSTAAKTRRTRRTSGDKTVSIFNKTPPPSPTLKKPAASPQKPAAVESKAKRSRKVSGDVEKEVAKTKPTRRTRKVSGDALDPPVAEVQPKPSRRTRKVSGEKASESSPKPSPDESKTAAKRVKAQAKEKTTRRTRRNSGINDVTFRD